MQALTRCDTGMVKADKQETMNGIAKHRPTNNNVRKNAPGIKTDEGAVPLLYFSLEYFWNIFGIFLEELFSVNVILFRVIYVPHHKLWAFVKNGSRTRLQTAGYGTRVTNGHSEYLIGRGGLSVASDWHECIRCNDFSQNVSKDIKINKNQTDQNPVFSPDGHFPTAICLCAAWVARKFDEGAITSR